MESTRPEPIWIAEQQVVLLHPDGRRETGHIAVGQPYVLAVGDPTGNYESHCPVEVSGLWSREHPMIGFGTLSALLNGVSFLGIVLHRFVSDGGRVLDAEDGTEVDAAALFGPLLREPPAPDNNAQH